MAKYSFVITDESLVDADGERVMIKGIDLTRFEKNPVCLFMHGRRWSSLTKRIVIGKWSNLQIKGSQLHGEVEFDASDEEAAAIEKKVAGGFLKACSPRYRPVAISEDALDKLPGQKGLTYTKSQLIEISIVDIPSNENAVMKSMEESPDLLKYLSKNFNPDDPADDVDPQKTPNKNPQKTPNKNMDTAIDSAIPKALGLPETASAGEIVGAINTLTKAKADAQALVQKTIEDEADQLVSRAIAKGLFTEDQKDTAKSWFLKDMEAARAFVGPEPAKEDKSKGLDEGEQTKLQKFLSKISDKGEAGVQVVKKYEELSQEDIDELKKSDEGMEQLDKLMQQAGIV